MPIAPVISHATTETQFWLPPRKMLQYTRVRIIGGLLFGTIFAGWMVLQWSNPVMRFIAGGLILITAWVTVASVLTDRRRARGRQIAVEPGALDIVTPTEHKRVHLADVHHAAWREDSKTDSGLWLYDRAGNVLAHLDTAFLTDQAEARSFLGWARRHTDLPFKVQWPASS